MVDLTDMWIPVTTRISPGHVHTGMRQTLTFGAESTQLVGEHSTQKVPAHLRDFILACTCLLEQILPSGDVVHRDMGVEPRASAVDEWLGHVRCHEAVLLRDGLRHVLSKGMPVSGHQGIVIFPVDLELTVPVLDQATHGHQHEKSRSRHREAEQGKKKASPHDRPGTGPNPATPCKW